MYKAIWSDKNIIVITIRPYIYIQNNKLCDPNTIIMVLKEHVKKLKYVI